MILPCALDQQPAPAVPTTGGGDGGTLDFVANSYDFASVSYVLANVVDRPAYRDGTGLVFPSQGSGGESTALLITPMKNKLATCQWSALFEIDAPFALDHRYLMTLASASFTYWIEVMNFNTWSMDCHNAAASPNAEDTVNGATIGIHKFAVTRTNSKCVVSVDGNAVVSDTTPCVLPVPGSPMVDFFFGGYSDRTGYTGSGWTLRSVTLYDTVLDDADLPILSA
jgi:hypothetical protein